MIALVRPPGSSFSSALSVHFGEAEIDLDRARTQHATYVDTLRSLGTDVIELPAENMLPDACFVEDCAVVVDGEALLCLPGAPSRQGEPETVLSALNAHIDRILPMSAGATLDGGDVLRLGSTLCVGRSTRTNDAGITDLREFAMRHALAVVPVDLPAGVLHLQTAVSAVTDDEVVGDPRLLADPAFAGVAARRSVPAEEPTGRSVLRAADAVVMAAGADKTASTLRDAGHRVIEVELGEFTKADGGPTCLSLRLG